MHTRLLTVDKDELRQFEIVKAHAQRFVSNSHHFHFNGHLSSIRPAIESYIGATSRNDSEAKQMLCYSNYF